MERFEKPSGVSDEERMKRAAAIFRRAVDNGQTEFFIGRFPKNLFTDRGRAINQMEPGRSGWLCLGVAQRNRAAYSWRP